MVKWYEDPVYIKMCDCPEIQAMRMNAHQVGFQQLENGDYYAFPDGSGSEVYCALCCEEGCQVSIYIWLPNQSQLQEMIGAFSSCWLLLLDWFGDPCDTLGENEFSINNKYFHQFTSMEQLWLSFVMWECYQKIWVNEEWVSQPPQ